MSKVQNPTLTIELIRQEARVFSDVESRFREPRLYGVTDGKAVGTYLEQKFRAFLKAKYTFEDGNSANGIDFPGLGVDIKVTSVRQPQSSCGFSSARQKVYGLGYGLLVFVYDKSDDALTKTAQLKFVSTFYIEPQLTGDFQLTKGLREILQSQGNADDLIAFMSEKNLPLDDIGMKALAEEVLRNTPTQGFLTISNALQWRLQYTRAMEKAGSVNGVWSIHRAEA